MVLAARSSGAQTTAAELASIDELRQTVDELRRDLRERNAAFADLQRRMEELERRIAAVIPETVAAPAAPVPPPPAPERPPSGGAAAGPEVGDVAEETPPPSAPGQVQVDEEEVATALERALIQEGAILLPPGTAQVEPSFTFVRQEANLLRVELEDGEQVVSVGESRQDSLTAGLTFRLGLPFDSQVSLSLPFRYQETETVVRDALGGVSEDTRDAVGFGDLSVGLSKGLLRERGWRPDLVAGLSWRTDTGQTDDGVTLGSGFDEVTASVTASKSQDPLVFVGDLSYTHVFAEDGFQPGSDIGLSFGTVLAASPETSLRFFLDQSFVSETEVNGREVPGSDEVVGLFSIGASSLLTSRVLLDFELGIGLTDGAPDYIIGIALPVLFDLPF